MDQIVIRKAAPADIPQLQTLSMALLNDPTSANDVFSNRTWPANDQGAQTLGTFLTDPSKAIWVAEDTGRIVGFLRAGIASYLPWRPIKRAQVFSLYVVPVYRSRQVGRGLCESFFMWARQHKATTAMLMAYADNTRAISFYESLGFAAHMVELERPL